jgi:N-acetylneuraminic acid mutarotase
MINGTPPPPRDSHSCTTVGDNLFVFGGTDGVNPLKDLYILDTSSHTWKCPSVRGEGPEAREGHSATLVGKRLFVFGGCGKSSGINEEIYYNDVYIFNTGNGWLLMALFKLACESFPYYHLLFIDKGP